LARRRRSSSSSRVVFIWDYRIADPQIRQSLEHRPRGLSVVPSSADMGRGDRRRPPFASAAAEPFPSAANLRKGMELRGPKKPLNVRHSARARCRTGRVRSHRYRPRRRRGSGLRAGSYARRRTRPRLTIALPGTGASR
jgi:hypothetical protein